MDNWVLHVDCNSFYVSCEMSERPSLRGKAVVVAGDPEARHGIVLAKSDAAKKAGIQTGHAVWQAKELCPQLIVLPPNYRLYLRMSRESRDIFHSYTGYVEPFGLDEAWLGLRGDTLEQARMAADEIRARIRTELGITASVGVADNKIMAKLGSDYKKPDATTVFTPEEYARTVWPLPAEDLLYVGHATALRLKRAGIYTIGDIVRTPPACMKALLGVNGEMLWKFAAGADKSPVACVGVSPDVKSIGNSTTTPRDLTGEEDIQLTLWVLAEAVAERLREQHFRARTLQISVRDADLYSFQRQTRLSCPTQLALDMVKAAMLLFKSSYDLSRQKPIRSLGIRACDLETTDGYVQLSMLAEEMKRQNQERIENTVDEIRRRFGHFAIQRASMLKDCIGGINPRDDHVIHPVSYR